MNITREQVNAIRANLGQTKKPNRRAAGGRAAKQSGDTLERAIVFGAGFSDRIHLEKLPGCGGRFVGKGRFVQQFICCDFVGCVSQSGRALFMDAKSSSSKYGFDLSNQKLLKFHQAEFLMRQSRAGAIAGLLVECRVRGVYLWLGAGAFPHLLAASGKTRWEDTAWVPLGDTTRHVNFEALLAAYGEGGKP